MDVPSADAEFADLLQRISAGDEQAAALMVRSFEPELRRFVRFRLTDPALRRFLDSLDVCQSVLAAFFVHIKDGKLRELPAAPRQLARLLSVMAQNKLTDKARRHRRELQSIKAGERALPEQVVDGKLAAVGDATEHAELVLAIRVRLQAPERDLLDRWMRGDEWPQIAADLGAAPDAVRKRLSRSIDRVANELGLIDEAL